MLIDDYVTGLDQVLRGPTGPKRDLVVEARDSLVDTAEALQSEGLARVEAERLAVEEFGDLREIAPGYQEELTVCAGRRLALLLFVSVPITVLLWSMIWQVFPADVATWADKPGWFFPVARSLDILQLSTGALGGLALLALGRGRRWIRRPRLVTRSLAVFVWASFPVYLGLGVALQFGSQGPVGFSDYLPGVGLSLVSAALVALQLHGAARCVRVSRLTPA